MILTSEIPMENASKKQIISYEPLDSVGRPSHTTNFVTEQYSNCFLQLLLSPILQLCVFLQRHLKMKQAFLIQLQYKYRYKVRKNNHTHINAIISFLIFILICFTHRIQNSHFIVSHFSQIQSRF